MKADPGKAGRRNPSGVRSETAVSRREGSKANPPRGPLYKAVTQVRPAGYPTFGRAEDNFVGGTRPSRNPRAQAAARRGTAAANRQAARLEGPKRSVPAKPAAKGKKGR